MKKILVVITRRIGDVLLSTPLIRSLRHAYPDAAIHVLVFQGTEGILQGNPDVDRILTVNPRMKLRTHMAFLKGIWRKYDLAVSVVPGDRPTLYACIAAAKRIGPVAEGSGQAWKRKWLTKWVPFDNLDTHTVTMNLRLAVALGIPPIHEVIVGWKPGEEERVRELLPFDQDEPYVVFHPYPMYAYKMWKREAWVELAAHLEGLGHRIVLTGGKDPEESAYVSGLVANFPEGTVNLAGKLSLGGVAYLLSRARAYVGPDTAVTHMAAALGIPTVALFGPSNPVKWGPWPKGCREDNPYRLRGTQKVNNVILLQGSGDCVPCMEEGCERNLQSDSACLQNLPTIDVIEALDGWLK